MTAARLLVSALAPTELYVDEAQYAIWAATPDWGYFSKPPLTAWLIGAARHVCGVSEACVRSPSALAWAGTSLFVFAIGRTLYGPRAGLWAGLAALTAPGVAFAARIVSTDAPLLLCWAAALFALVRLRAGGGWGVAVLLGAALGLGLLAKYAAAYFIGCAVVAAVVDVDTRRALLSGKGAAALGLALLILSPNLAWNLGHGLATLRHTAGNTTGDGLRFTPLEVPVFAAAQFVLAGPVALAGALAALRRPEGADRMLLAFVVPLMLVVSVKAALGGANANWAAPALAAAWVLGPAVLIRTGRVRWLAAGLTLGLVFQVGLAIADLQAPRIAVAGRSPYESVLGWGAMGRTVSAAARGAGADAIVAERRADVAGLIRYAPAGAPPLFDWPPAVDGRPENHFQMTRPLVPSAGQIVLAVAPCDGVGRFAGWRRVKSLGPLETPAGAGRPRRRWLFRLQGPPPRIVRPPACS